MPRMVRSCRSVRTRVCILSLPFEVVIPVLLDLCGWDIRLVCVQDSALLDDLEALRINIPGIIQDTHAFSAVLLPSDGLSQAIQKLFGVTQGVRGNYDSLTEQSDEQVLLRGRELVPCL